jgi:hypothetical protein
MRSFSKHEPSERRARASSFGRLAVMPKALLISTIVMLVGCASPSSPGHVAAAPEAPCELLSPDVLVLRGSTDQQMLDCVSAAPRSSVKTVVVTSPGGVVSTAIPIAEIIAGMNAEVVVRGQCNSSCANYFLPVARRVTLEPGALVLLHGSIDDAYMAKTQNAPPEARERDRAAYAMQRAFAEKRHVALGWLLFRAPEPRASGRFGEYLSGDVERWGERGAHRDRAIAVEERLMRSCLRGVEITPFKDTAVQRLYTDAGLRERLRRRGVYPSGTLACTSAAGSAPPA